MVPSKIVHLASAVHLWRLLACSFLLSTVMQGALILLTGVTVRGKDDAEVNIGILCSFLGLGGLHKALGVDPLALALARGCTLGLMENIPSLYLQSLLFSLTFGLTDDGTKKRQLVSMALSATSTMRMVLDTLHLLCDVASPEDLYSSSRCTVTMKLMILACSFFFMLA